jgi:hypothetical protein
MVKVVPKRLPMAIALEWERTYRFQTHSLSSFVAFFVSCFRGKGFGQGFLRRTSRISCLVALGFLERMPAIWFAVKAAEIDVPA